MCQSEEKSPEKRKCLICGINDSPAIRIGKWFYRNCDDCNKKENEARILIEKQDEIAQKSKHIQRRLDDTIPAHFNSARLENLNPALLKEISGENGVYIFGNVGCGKSYVLSALAKKDIALGVWPVKIINWERFLSHQKSLYLKPIGSVEESLLSTIKTLVLYIDDISIGSAESDFSLKTLYSILDYRIENKLKTSFSANKSPNELSKVFDERIESRIKECCKIIHYAGKDRRTEKWQK